MLRTVRSLPSLRLLAQKEANVVSKSVASVEASTGTLFQYQQESFRHVHSTTKKSTILFDANDSTKYTTMNLNGLKMECRKRGLKVSGRKMDLVQRLVHNDSSPVADSRSYSSITSTISDLQNTGPPMPKYVEQASLKDKQDLKLQEQIKKELKNRIVNEQKKSEVKAKQALKSKALKKAKELERQVQEQHARDEIRLQAERASQLERLAAEQRARQLAADCSAALDAASKVRAQREAQLMKEKIEKEALLAKQIEEQRQRHPILTAVKNQNIFKIQAQTIANAESKSRIISEAREQLRAQAQKQKEKEQEQQHEESNKTTELTFRDKVFFSGFGLTTATWWYYNEA